MTASVLSPSLIEDPELAIREKPRAMPDESDKPGRPILVTGGTSHTGERVVARLLARGEQVRILTRDPDKPYRLGMNLDAVGICRGDLTAPWTLWEALEGCRALVNVAHIRFGETCVRACNALGVSRLVVMSSTRILTRWPCETSRAVARGESAVATSDLDWTTLRASMIYGGPRDNNVTRLVRWIQRHRWAPLVAGGRGLIQPVFVDDLADLIVRVLDEPSAIRRRFTVAGPEPISYRMLMQLLARELNRPVRFVSVPGGAAVAGAWILERFAPGLRIRMEQVRRLLEDKVSDIGETKAALDFSPRPIEDGVRVKLAAMDR